MLIRVCLPAAVFVACAVVGPGCAGLLHRGGPVAAGAAPTAIERDALPDSPVETLLAESQQRFEFGQVALGLGHHDRARAAFERSLDLLRQAPPAARDDLRLRETLERLGDEIRSFEAGAAAGDDSAGEGRPERAAIDDLLAMAIAEAVPPAVADTVARDPAAAAHDLPVPFDHPRVLAYVDAFQGRLRDWVVEGLSRGSQYLPMIQQVLSAEGLPLDLAWVPLVESAYKPTALSRASARGVWQFMRGTAVAHGLRYDWYVDERADPEKATLAAARYLKTLNRIFDGDWHLALASYNGGPGLVQRALTRTRTTDFWSLAAKPRAIPRETREYVPLALAAMVVGRNPAHYGLDVVAVEPPSCDLVSVPGPIDLALAAEWSGGSVETIRALNPELRRWTTPPGDTAYRLRVPAGAGAAFEARLAEADPANLATFRWHVVTKGETLTSIARRLGVTRADLAGASGLPTTSRLTVGQRLVVPRPPAAPRPAGAGQVAAMPSGRQIYLVKPGDTLYGIARAFGTTVAVLMAWNELEDTLIHPGDGVMVPAPRRAASGRR